MRRIVNAIVKSSKYLSMKVRIGGPKILKSPLTKKNLVGRPKLAPAIRGMKQLEVLKNIFREILFSASTTPAAIVKILNGIGENAAVKTPKKACS